MHQNHAELLFELAYLLRHCRQRQLQLIGGGLKTLGLDKREKGLAAENSSNGVLATKPTAIRLAQRQRELPGRPSRCPRRGAVYDSARIRTRRQQAESAAGLVA